MNNQMKQNLLSSHKGITLVALVITILILLILGSVTVGVLVNQGILGHSKEAKEEYIIASEKEDIRVGYRDYQERKKWERNPELIIDGAKSIAGDDDAGWDIIFEETGNHYYLKGDGSVIEGPLKDENNGEDITEPEEDIPWVDNGDGTFTRDGVTIANGDYVDYDPTKDENGNTVPVTGYTSYSINNASASKNNGRTSGYTNDQVFSVNTSTGGWKVLGVQNGKMQLIAVNAINPVSGGLPSDHGDYCIEGKEGFASAIGELNAICALYGQGKGAISARSMTIDDVNKITGYNPDKTGTGGVCDAGNIHAYGNEVTYYWQGGYYPYYSGSNGKTGTLNYSHNDFVYWDGSAWQTVARDTSASTWSRKKITTLKCTAYWYYPTTLKNSDSGSVIGIATNSNAYKMLFGRYYWLASDTVLTGADHADFGLKVVEGTDAGTVYIAGSSSSPRDTPSLGICPVITLSKKFNLAKRNGIWQIVDSTQ